MEVTLTVTLQIPILAHITGNVVLPENSYGWKRFLRIPRENKDLLSLPVV